MNAPFPNESGYQDGCDRENSCNPEEQVRRLGRRRRSGRPELDGPTIDGLLGRGSDNPIFVCNIRSQIRELQPQR